MKYLLYPFHVLYDLLKKIVAYRSLIGLMVIRTIKIRYAGTLVGLTWSIVHPLMTLLVYWFVFSVGFKLQPAGNAPFVLVFLCGLIPWITFSETLQANTAVLVDNYYLASKTVFPTEILPVVNWIASMITHGVMLVLLVLIMALYHVPLTVFSFQVLYYLAALCLLSVGLGWLFAAANVVFRDLGQMLGVLLNLWFWSTPIVWFAEMIPEPYRFLIKANPIYYIVQGYKASFIYPAPFWGDVAMGAYFWGVTLLCLTVGALVFQRLKREFAEVL
jgi:lipopolysaccharide transport system permease protein/teichoic acid transport system permease protein